MAQTLDEVISANVRRLREERDYKVADLANKLRVGRHAVYDYERPRPDREPHAFTWSELVALCAALECSLFELVLPGEGEALDLPSPAGDVAALVAVDPSDIELALEGVDPAHLEGTDPADIDIDSGTLAAVGVIPPGRDALAQVAFHLPSETIAAVIAGPIAKESEQWRKAVREAQEQTMREARQIMQERIRSALADMEGETDE